MGIMVTEQNVNVSNHSRISINSSTDNNDRGRDVRRHSHAPVSTSSWWRACALNRKVK